MSGTNPFHLSTKAAELYQAQRVPAIFLPMAEATLNAVELPEAAKIVDVACGTGVMARAVAARLTAPSHIIGCDINPAMIEVARQGEPKGRHRFEWVTAPAEDMPLEAGQFDLVFCQHGLQFFPDKSSALAEMRRLLRPGGRLVLTCWRAIPPFFAVVAEELDSVLGAEAAATAVQPFLWNDEGMIAELISDAGFDCPAPRALAVARRLKADVDTLRHELLSTPNEPLLRAAGEEAISQLARRILERVERFRQNDTLVMPQAAHLFEARAVSHHIWRR